MGMRSERFAFPGSQGHNLSARLDSPDGAPRAVALFAHCFSCGKDVLAAGRIARALTQYGIAVLRFDFTGLGSSDGDFANTNFSSNVGDLLAAANHLRQVQAAPTILIGHSLGGTAMLAVAGDIPEARAIATIAAPYEPGHVANQFRDRLAEIEAQGEAEVVLAGRPFRIRRQFLDDLRAHSHEERIVDLRKALLVLHAPLDAVVGIDNATEIFVRAKHPKSFISLDRADHLLSQPADAEYAATVIAAWASRYTEEEARAPEVAAVPEAVVVQETGQGRFQQAVAIGAHRLISDEPRAVGGDDSGPGPYDLLLAGLGACTSMTMRMYAERQGWPLERATVVLRHRRIHAADCADCETREGKIDEITREITLPGPLDDTQRARLLEIADRCPVHRSLHSEIKIDTAERRA